VYTIDEKHIIIYKKTEQPLASQQQQQQPIRRITGVVTDENSEPVIGANVVEKGTTNGTVTDINGAFSLSVSGKLPLHVSYIGYTEQDVAIGSKTSLNIQLAEDTKALDEVVVVGYGTMKKSDLSGATTSVSSTQLMGSITSGLDQALLGRAAGVSGVRTSGQPGSSVSIRIRGTSTLNADAEPLYVIDGVPVSGGYSSSWDVGLGDLGGGKPTFSALSTLNPADIQSIEVLKDASSTAIYGSRGSNGVVLITTKRGRANDTKINYEGYYGVQQQGRRLSVMNLREFAEYNNDVASETAGKAENVMFADPSILGEGTNWQSAMFNTAPVQSHQLTASGGSEKAQYSMGIGYFDQEGTLIGSDFSRLSGRLNIDAQARKWLKLGSSLMLSTSTDHLGVSAAGEGIISTAVRHTPDIPVYNMDGTYAGAEGEGVIGKVNPIAKALDELHTFDRTRITGNVFADVNLLKGLVWRSEIGGDINFSEALNFHPTYAYGNVTNDQNYVDNSNYKNTFWQIKNY
jgi:TonB-linked SusC/RagA family outer membrane protein